MDNFANFPEPPEGMNIRVHRSRNGLQLTGFHTISTVWHYLEKSLYLFIIVPFWFAGGVVFSLWGIIGIVFFHWHIQQGDAGPIMPQWAALAFIVPFLAVFVIVFGYSGWYILLHTVRMTQDRPDWELNISLNKWYVTLYSKYQGSDSDDNPVRHELEPSHIQRIGVDMIDHVYAEIKNSNSKANSHEKEVSSRIELTKSLLSNEAAWVEHALKSLLNEITQ